KFPSEEAARKDMERLLREKLGKGYVDAAGSGADATSPATSGEGLIPFIAFSSINRRDDIGQSPGTFFGKRVGDYDPEKPAKPHAGYRFRSDWENDNLLSDLETFVASDAAPNATALVIGSWHSDDPERTSEEVVKALVKGKDRLSNLAALYVGDITSEE